MVLAESFYKKNNDGSKTWVRPSEVNINKMIMVKSFPQQKKKQVMILKLVE